MTVIARERTAVVARKRKVIFWGAAIVVAASVLLALPLGAPAHDTPADVTVQAFLKPEGQTLRLLLRVPLTAMQDINFPTRGPGYLLIDEADTELREGADIWLAEPMQLFEDGTELPYPEIAAIKVSIPSDPSFREYDTALEHVFSPRVSSVDPRLSGACPDEDDPEYDAACIVIDLIWQQAMLDVLFEFPIQSEDSRFSIRPGMERLASRVQTVLRFMPPNGVVRAFQFVGDPGIVSLDPRWHQAALRFVQSGFLHILDGIDHLLFLLCLVIPFRRFNALIPIVTAFTVAHSITLIASAYGFAPNTLWFPPLVETVIAASILYMALENVIGANVRRRWIVTFGFGLVHGFGFSFALRESLQFAGSHLLTSLLAFNVGVELGQLLVLLLCIPALEILFRYVLNERMGTLILSIAVAHTGWHWMSERAVLFSQYRIQWPALSVGLFVDILGWLVLALIVGGLGWLAFGMLWNPAAQELDQEASPAEGGVSEATPSAEAGPVSEATPATEDPATGDPGATSGTGDPKATPGPANPEAGDPGATLRTEE